MKNRRKFIHRLLAVVPAIAVTPAFGLSKQSKKTIPGKFVHAVYFWLKDTTDISVFKRETADFISEYIVTGEYKYPIYVGSGSKNAVETFLSRAFELNAPGYIYELTLRSGYQDGSTFGNIAIGLIPRILWPDKPSIPQGARFSSEILGFEKVSIGMLIAGELFWNFGFTGVIIGSLLI